MSHVILIENLYAAFGRGDVATVLGAFEPNIEWREAEGNPYQMNGQAWIGPEAVLTNLFARLAAEWDGFAVNTRKIHDAGAVIVVEGRYTGTHKTTRKTLDAQMCHVWKVQRGKILSFQQYMDTAQMQSVMGER